MLLSKPLYVLLPVHNRISVTLQFIDSLKKQNFKDFQLILIDDGSTDGTANAVLNELPETHVIRGNGNLWWAGALQFAINELKLKKIDEDVVILIINDDTIIPVDFLEKGLSLIKSTSKQIFCAQAVSLQTGLITNGGVHVDWWKFRFLQANKEVEINCLPTRGLFLRYIDLIRIGEFRPKILPHYFSDYEFTIRAKKRGYGLRCPSELNLAMNETTTGIHSIDTLPLRAYLRKAFQTRAAINPWTAFKFISIAAPLIYKPVCYYRLAIYFLKCVVKATLNGI